MKGKTLQEKIEEITSSKSPLKSSFEIADYSTQQNLRLSAAWRIDLQVDLLHYQKNLSEVDTVDSAWYQMRCLESAISTAATCSSSEEILLLAANAKTKSGAAEREVAKQEFMRTQQLTFLSAYKKAALKNSLKKQTKNIAALQAQQKALMVKMREHNSEIISARKTAAADQREKNELALKSGEFWKADEKTLKTYFHPPFPRNYLADVSEKWRAALFTEMDSTAWKAGKEWRHKNIGTGRTYLCGIDDNGDEWGVRVNLSAHLGRDFYGDLGYAGVTVEDAMSELFNVAKRDLDTATRQGDLLFCPCTIPAATELHDEVEAWTVRESHAVTSEGLRRNGQYFVSENPVTITHTSHAPVILPAGAYRLYQLQDAD